MTIIAPAGANLFTSVPGACAPVCCEPGEELDTSQLLSCKTPVEG